jgi:hypothetical protein
MVTHVTHVCSVCSAALCASLDCGSYPAAVLRREERVFDAAVRCTRICEGRTSHFVQCCESHTVITTLLPSSQPKPTTHAYLYALGQIRAGSVRLQRSAPLAAVLMPVQSAAEVNVRPLLAVTPVGSCLSQAGLLASADTCAVGVMTLTKSASTCVEVLILAPKTMSHANQPVLEDQQKCCHATSLPAFSLRNGKMRGTDNAGSAGYCPILVAKHRPCQGACTHSADLLNMRVMGLTVAHTHQWHSLAWRCRRTGMHTHRGQAKKNKC